MKTISKYYNYLASDSLYGNSIYLMLSTAIMAFFGFFFWIINARLFTPEQVGIATTLISVMTLISSFSLLGLGNGLIRYLPTSERKNKKINTAFTLVGLTSIIITIIYLLFIKIISPSLLFVRENVFFSLLFIIFIAFTSLANLSENIFIAYRSSLYVLLKNTIFSIIKIVLPIFLISLGAYGIFASVGIAMAISFLLSVGFLVRKFNYLIKLIVDTDVVKRIFKFSLGNYAAGFIGGLPAMVLPILITNSIGAKFSAYFYMDMMIINFLYIIPMATSQSLFAEGSYGEMELKTHLKKAIKIISLILIPAIILTLSLGKYVLLAFGRSYSNEGVILLQLLTVSVIFNSINYIIGAIFRIKNMVKELIILGFVNSCLVLFLYMVLIKYGLFGVGIAWMLGQVITSVVSIIMLVKSKYE
ncbi:MAG: hypothetical protein UT23_C0011G0037 [Candidatus Woesebacteria bacterium GW2011_GWA1_39_12]|uniref:Polysaccharide biosynthesis protein n=1 Tax=Candidatus Woesebacteria bacterium GW2011_GWA1_39_12 TaxID=1618549 RepID=A0A0G0Q7B3_9BACT|nr:MAG: hypothetical protein UT23_C0011G0037 [Candidatus Woesebacteria bacterium GW2011_GWA1_39_12]